MIMDINDVLETVNKISSIKGKLRYLERLIEKEKDKKRRKELVALLMKIEKSSGKRMTFEEIHEEKTIEIPEIDIKSTKDTEEVEEIEISSKSKSPVVEEIEIGVQQSALEDIIHTTFSAPEVEMKDYGGEIKVERMENEKETIENEIGYLSTLREYMPGSEMPEYIERENRRVLFGLSEISIPRYETKEEVREGYIQKEKFFEESVEEFREELTVGYKRKKKLRI